MSEPAASPVRTERRGRVLLVTIDNPPVNALSQPVRAGLAEALRQAAADADVGAVVIACAGRTFSAGADIREFGKPPVPPVLPEVVATLAAFPKPVVAALHGTALGGGFELALGAHARVAAPDAKVGLPEVKLGIIPGAGGTQLLPRLVGTARAIEAITSARQIGAQEAARLGLVDVVAGGDLVTAALSHADACITSPLIPPAARQVPPDDAEAAATAAATARKKARGEIAPVRAIEAIGAAATRPFAEGLALERRIFTELVGSDQAAALRHVFFAEREVAKVEGIEGVVPRPVETIGIVGAGTMGAGIAVACADAGLAVVVVETDDAALGRGRERIEGLYGRAVKSGRIDASVATARLARIGYTTVLDELARANLVVEAVFEDMAVKQALFARLDPILRPGTILATNTSYLDVDAIASGTARPSDVLGLHFFSPANVMRLLEVVRGRATAPDVLASGLALAKRLGKLAVVCGVCDGFVGNRMLAVWRRQAEYMLEDGALPHEIDAALEAFGLPMGPFAVQDLAGLDIALARRKRLAATRDPHVRDVSLVEDLAALGRLGQKTGAGWYRYVDGRREIDSGVTDLVLAASRAKGIARRAIPPEEIVARIRAAMVNEGAAILGEGIVARALAIDLVMINGYGYPAWRGGPMFEASRTGLAAILEEVRRTHARDGKGWEPSPLLVRLAETGAPWP